jgi:hypothetical protein
VATATETPIATPPIIRSELNVQASARTESRQLDSAALCGAVRRNENQRTVPRFQFSHEHQNWNNDQWGRILFVDDTCIFRGVGGQIRVQRDQDTAARSQCMVRCQSDFARKIDIRPCLPFKECASRQSLVLAWILVVR